MAKKSNNDAALKETKRSNEQSQRNFEEQMRMMRKQMKGAESAAVQIPAYDPPAPAPTRSSLDVAAAGREARMQSRRRYGWNKSVSPASVQSSPVLGGATAL